jgi:hypothetical protein
MQDASGGVTFHVVAVGEPGFNASLQVKKVLQRWWVPPPDSQASPR